MSAFIIKPRCWARDENEISARGKINNKTNQNFFIFNSLKNYSVVRLNQQEVVNLT